MKFSVVILTNTSIFGILVFVLIAALAQLVERIHGKDEVDGSSPSSGFGKTTFIGRCLFYWI
jgi:hypothetical protein